MKLIDAKEADVLIKESQVLESNKQKFNKQYQSALNSAINISLQDEQIKDYYKQITQLIINNYIKAKSTGDDDFSTSPDSDLFLSFKHSIHTEQSEFDNSKISTDYIKPKLFPDLKCNKKTLKQICNIFNSLPAIDRQVNKNKFEKFGGSSKIFYDFFIKIDLEICCRLLKQAGYSVGKDGIYLEIR